MKISFSSKILLIKCKHVLLEAFKFSFKEIAPFKLRITWLMLKNTISEVLVCLQNDERRYAYMPSLYKRHIWIYFWSLTRGVNIITFQIFKFLIFFLFIHSRPLWKKSYLKWYQVRRYFFSFLSKNCCCLRNSGWSRDVIWVTQKFWSFPFVGKQIAVSKSCHL